VRELGDEPWPELPDGIRFVSIEERPELLRELYDLASEGYADLAIPEPISVPVDEWLREEATLPGGSYVAFARDEIIGYSGLVRRPQEGVAEDGLTVVRRAWRRRGLATLLKRAELAWASENGIREVVTWTQRGNDGMRAVNEALGYVYRTVSVTMHASLEIVLERVTEA
jgi:GNAT superfamily N-acetyltransferase